MNIRHLWPLRLWLALCCLGLSASAGAQTRTAAGDATSERWAVMSVVGS